MIGFETYGSIRDNCLLSSGHGQDSNLVPHSMITDLTS